MPGQPTSPPFSTNVPITVEKDGKAKPAAVVLRRRASRGHGGKRERGNGVSGRLSFPVPHSYQFGSLSFSLFSIPFRIIF